MPAHRKSAAELRRALLLSCVVICALLLAIYLLSRLVTLALHTEAAQDIDLAAVQMLSSVQQPSAPDSGPLGRRYNVSGAPLWRNAADLKATFHRLLSSRGQHWQPRVLRPPTATKHGWGGSWVVSLDNFTTAEEARAIVDAVGSAWRPGGVEGAGAEIALGARRGDVAWCTPRDRTQRPELAHAVGRVLERIQSAVGVSAEHFENTQLLRYNVGDYYVEHHDSPASFARTTGVRVLTAYLYLSDLPADGGGETAFARLGGDGGLAIAPQVGRLLVWPNVRDDNPARGVADMRMLHSAQKVKRGVKFGANVWVRLHRLGH